MAVLSQTVEALLALQNGDGGWGYLQGTPSWTEPTTLAVLAMYAHGKTAQPYSRALDWILSNQQAGGGWPVSPTVEGAASVTNLCLVALAQQPENRKQFSAGLAWSLAQAKPDYTRFERFMHWVQNVPAAEANTSGGCPWVPGTAAWVAPTVAMVIAFGLALKLGYTDPNLATQIRRARAFLLSRECPDGGWNTGSSQLRTKASYAYPEMTGMALLAFDRASRVGIERALHLVRTMLKQPESSEAQSWLSMAGHLHHLGVPPSAPKPCRSVRDLALYLLATAGLQNPLLV